MNKTYQYVAWVLTLFFFLGAGWATYNHQQHNLAIPAYFTPTEDSVEHASLNLIFKENSLKWGLAAQHRQSSQYLSSFLETVGAGVCVLDVNQDGWMDIFVVGGSGFTREYGKQAWWHNIAGNRLFLNEQGRYLKDISTAAGLNDLQTGMGCSVADLDADGDTDLIVSGLGGHFLYSNDGSGVFKKIDGTALLSDGKWATQAIFADVNRDGLLDIYTSNFVNYHKGARTFERNQGFVASKNVNFDPSLYDPQANQLFINQGNFEFSDVSVDYFVSNALGRSLGARWHDVNQDGNLDLLVLNGFDSASRVYLNDGKGKFSEAKDTFRALQIVGGRDVLIGDMLADGQTELYFTQGAGIRNTFLKQFTDNRNQSFSEQSEIVKLSKKEALYANDWGAVAADMNNDGADDIYIAAGGSNPEADSQHVSQRQANRFYLNAGDGSFIALSGEDPNVAAMSSRAVVTVDLNNDGQLELLVANNNDAIQLFEVAYTNKQHWLGISIIGKQHWQGASIKVRTANTEQTKILSFKQNFFSQSDPRLHFGLGQEDQVLELTLELEQGPKLSFSDLQGDRYYQIFPEQNLIKPLDVILEKSPLVSGFAKADEQDLINWARLFINADLSAQSHLSALWLEATLEVKKRILAMFAENAELKPHYVVFDALRDPDPELTVTAINILKKQELEYSISWLIPLLSNTDHNIACAVADTLRFFFDQEEAVVYRKQLTVAPMLKLLPQAQDETKICMLKALAAAENKRAVPTLIALLNDLNNNTVVTETIRALGLIRDTRGVKPILRVLQQNTSADTAAAAFIALSRLNYDELEAAVSAYFSLDKQPGRGAKQRLLLSHLAALQKLYENSEAIVLPTQWLFRVNTFLAQSVNTDSSLAILIEYLKTLAASQNQGFYAMAQVYLDNVNTLIHEQAFQTLLQLSNSLQASSLEKLLLLESLNTQQNILRGLTGKYRFSPFFVNSLIEKYLHDETDQHSTLELASLMSSQDLSTFFYSLLERVPDSAQIEILGFASILKVSLKRVPKSLLKPNGGESGLAFLIWYYQHLGSVANNKDELELRVKLNSVIYDNKVSQADKIHLLKLAATKDPYVANQFFDYYKEQLSTDEVLDIIDSLPYRSRSEKLVQYVATVLEKKTSSRTQKLFASVILPAKSTAQVLKYLR
ncbi:MAG: hypothetical protein ACI8R9_001700 [Paraglaciecola sp.]|jgi:hypothetical protein